MIDDVQQTVLQPMMGLLNKVAQFLPNIAAALLLLEEVLGAYTELWMAVLGPVLILLVLVARRGLFGLIDRRRDRHA